MSARRTGQERVLAYRSSGTRSEREPLSANRRPSRSRVQPRGGAAGRSPRGRFAGAARTYGWRLYAVPILAALTVLVVVQAVRGVPGDASAQQAAVSPPIVSERPAGTVDPTANTAALPPGGPYTQRGKGTWHVVRGPSTVAGKSGPIRSYTVEVEDGMNAAQYGGDVAFARMVRTTLSDPRSWIGDGSVRLRRIDDPSHADFQIALTSPATVHQLCGAQIRYESSCYTSARNKVVINLARWVRGARAFNGDLGTYRQYAINHEVGHALGQHHVGCTSNGGLAPVMMQQTFGVSDNYVYRLNQNDPSNADAVPADGKVCKPNAWPVLGPPGTPK